MTLYAAHLTMGYLLMLVIMMYQVCAAAAAAAASSSASAAAASSSASAASTSTVPLLCLCRYSAFLAHRMQTELFVGVVLGLMSGHAIFNWQSPVMEKIDPCCQHGEIDDDDDDDDGDDDDDELKYAIAGVSRKSGGSKGNRVGSKGGIYAPLMTSSTTSNCTVLSVQGMMCQHNCGTTVSKSLGQVAGVQRSDVDVPNGRVTVHHTAGVNAADLVSAVEAVGFEAATLTMP
jgi:copper chaperone CopZ